MGDGELSCGMKCVKMLLFAFNAIFWLAGGAVLGIGIWILVDGKSFREVLGSDLYNNAAYVLIVAGAFVFLVGFSGCCGAIRESKCLLWTYFIFLFLIFALELAAGILAFIFYDDLKEEVTKALNETLVEKYGKDTFKDITTAFDEVQQTLECCGLTNATDWKRAENKNFSTQPPGSCCTKSNSNCTYTSGVYMKGCVPQFEDWVKNNVVLVGGVALGTGFVELLGMIFACCLIKAIGDYTSV